MIGLMQTEQATVIRAHSLKPQRVYSRTIADHKERMVVRRAEQLIRKVSWPLAWRDHKNANVRGWERTPYGCVANWARSFT